MSQVVVGVMLARARRPVRGVVMIKAVVAVAAAGARAVPGAAAATTATSVAEAVGSSRSWW